MKPSPVEYVPPELWTIIFDFVQLPPQRQQTELNSCHSDLYYCYKVCSTFQNILSRQSSTWFFDEAVELISPYLPNSDILRCRRVCKSWRLAVDKFWEVPEQKSSLLASSRQCVCPFTSTEQLLTFMEYFMDYPANPFPTRNISLAYWHDPGQHINRPGYSEFWDLSQSQLVHPFGHYLTTLHLRLCFRTHPSTFFSLDLLTSCLDTTPNLRILHIDGYTAFHREFSFTENNFRFVSLPPLSHLESLYFKPGRCDEHANCNTIPLAVQYFITHQYCQSLRQLQISFADSPGFVIDEVAIPMAIPNLRELRIQIMHPMQLHFILNPTNSNMKHLRSVSVEIVSLDTFTVNQIHALGEILDLLQNYKESLRELEISADEYICKNSIVTPKEIAIFAEFARFVKLRYLRIAGYYISEAELVEYLPEHLQFLHVSANKCTNRGERYVSLDFTDWARFWQAFPRLRWIRVDNIGNGGISEKHTVTYRRERWERRKRLYKPTSSASKSERFRYLFDGRYVHIKKIIGCIVITLIVMVTKMMRK